MLLNFVVYSWNSPHYKLLVIPVHDWSRFLLGGTVWPEIVKDRPAFDCFGLVSIPGFGR